MRNRRIMIWWTILVLISLSCQTLMPTATETGAPTVPTATSPPTSPVTETAQPVPTDTPEPTPSPEPTETSTATLEVVPIPTEENISGFALRYHPDGGLYVGDQVSIEVITTRDQEFPENTIIVSTADGTQLHETGFGRFGIGGRYQATLNWVWDTSNLQPGEHELSFSIQPADIQFEDTVTLLPADEVPFPGPDARWNRYESDCCLYYTISGTAADRDIETITEITDFQADRVTTSMGIEFEDPVVITLLPRVLGHGGFARGEIFVTYMDRKYAGGLYENVIHHEMVHILDSRLESEFRPTLFVEGLAVYLTGGHFKQEELIPRAAALLSPDLVESMNGLDWYIPMGRLTGEFYTSQHEIGYLEAGALIEYMVERWGYPAFDEFYRSIPHLDDDTQYASIDSALINHLGIDFQQLEDDFIARLQEETVTEDEYNDVRLLVEYYDTARRYQQLLDPSAYFLTAWLPDGETMRERGIVADFLRHPEDVEHIALETMLVFAGEALEDGRYTQIDDVLAAANQVINGIASGIPEPFSINPLAEDHYAITRAILATSYEPYLIDVEQREAIALATFQDEEPSVFVLNVIGADWVIRSLSD